MTTKDTPAPRALELLNMDALALASECLRSVAHPMRLRLVQMLLHDQYTVGELAEMCGVPSYVASEHLGLMRDRGLLTFERQGRKVYYHVAMPAVEGIINCVQRNFGPPWQPSDRNGADTLKPGERGRT